MFHGSARRSVKVVAAVAAMTVALGACSSSGSTGGGGTSGAPKTTKITIMLGGKTISWSPMYVAQAKGYFADQGLDVTFTSSSQGATGATAAVVSGSAFIAFAGALSAIAPIKKKAPVKMAIVLTKGFGQQLVATNDFMTKHHLTSSSSYGDKIAALKGAKIGTLAPGDSVEQYVGYLFNQAGMDLSRDATTLALSTPANQLAAIKNKQVDVVGASPPTGAHAVAGGFGQILLEPSEVTALTDYPYSMGIVNDSTIKDHPDQLVAFATAVMHGISDMTTDPSGSEAILKKEFPDFSDADFQAVLAAENGVLTKTPVVTSADFDALTKFADVQGAPIGVSYSDAVESALVQQGVDKFNSGK